MDGRHVKCITASPQGNRQHWDYPVQEGLVEPLEGKSIPNHVMCARAVCSIDDDGFLPVQILNESQQTVTLYKGTRVAILLPLHSVYVVEDIHAIPTTGLPNTEVSEEDVDIEGELFKTQKGELMALLKKYKSLFQIGNNQPIGCTSVVKHNILTEGPPI
jgi:hypothetical protein